MSKARANSLGATVFQDSIGGLILSNNGSDSDHDIDIASGTCVVRNGTDVDSYDQSSTQTIAIDDSNDRVDGSTLDASTHYNVLVGLDNGTLVQGFSKTNSLPSGWDYYRRIGSVITNSSSNINGFQQTDNLFTFNVFRSDVSDNSPPTGSFGTATLSVPPNTIAICTIQAVVESSDYVDASVVPTHHTAGVAQQTIVSGYNGGSSSNRDIKGQFMVEADQSSQVNYELGHGGSSVSVEIWTRGWIDDRGRND